MNKDQGPVGTGKYVVREGDCLESVAQAHGFFWETVWNHGDNREVKNRRGDPHCLLPGDRLAIPEKRTREETAAHAKRHRFKRKGVPSVMKIQVRQLGEPRANQPYLADIDGDLREGTTDGDGLVCEPITPNAKHCRLTIGKGDGAMVLELELGGLDPLSETSGVQKRLENLGYKCTVTGELDEQTRNALKAFQKMQDLGITGEPDAATLQALKELHKG